MPKGLTPGSQYVLQIDSAGGDPSTVHMSILDTGCSSLRVATPDQVDAGSSFTVCAAVYENDVSSAPQTFTISTAPSGVSVQLEEEPAIAMVDDGTGADETSGDGVYTAELVAPLAGSSSDLVVRVTGQDSLGISFERVNTVSVTIREPRAVILGETTYRTETDASGKVTALLVDVPVTAAETCSVRLDGDISSAGSLAAQASTEITLSASESTSVTLRFAAGALYQNLDASGAFTLSRLALLDTTDEDQALLEEQTDVLSGTLVREDLVYAGSSVYLDGTNPSASQDLELRGSSSAASEVVAGAEYSIDDGDWTTLTDDGASWGETEVEWSLALTLFDGIHLITVRATGTGGAAIAGTEASVSFAVDTVGPWGELELERSADPETPLDVLATSSLTDLSSVTEMRFSTDEGATWTDWETYETTKTLTLTAGAGIKTVSAEFLDEAGNVGELEGSLRWAQPSAPSLRLWDRLQGVMKQSSPVPGSRGIRRPSGVTFDSVAATSYSVDSDTQITAVAPAHSAGGVRVAVVSDDWIGSADTEAAHYSYVSAPAVYGLSPSSGPRTGGTSVTITGIDLTDATVVTFGGVEALSFSVDSDTQITATAPAHGSGTVDVQVTAAGGLSDTGGAADDYTYYQTYTLTYSHGDERVHHRHHSADRQPRCQRHRR